MFFSFAFCTFFKIFHVRLGKKSKSVSFSRVYVCVKAKLTLVTFFSLNLSLWSCYGCFSFNRLSIVWLQIGILNSRQGGVECRRHFWGDSIHCPLLCWVFVTIICICFQHKESLISASRQDSVNIHK